jgi:hypothetical protein
MDKASKLDILEKFHKTSGLNILYEAYKKQVTDGTDNWEDMSKFVLGFTTLNFSTDTKLGKEDLIIADETETGDLKRVGMKNLLNESESPADPVADTLITIDKLVYKIIKTGDTFTASVVGTITSDSITEISIEPYIDFESTNVPVTAIDVTFMSSSATAPTYNLTQLKTVNVYWADNIPAVKSDAQSTDEKIVVSVPYGTKAKYTALDVWKDMNIVTRSKKSVKTNA